MISLVKREDYSSEEEYQEAYKEMCKFIEWHNKAHSDKKLRKKFSNKKE